MITYKDNLKLRIEKLQKAIDEVSDINGSLKIGSGVIVDLIVNSVNTNSITSKNANVINTLKIFISNSTISADALSTGERFYHSLFPSNFNILINNNTYSCYVIRTRSSGLMSSNNLHMMFKFTDVNCEYTTTTIFP